MSYFVISDICLFFLSLLKADLYAMLHVDENEHLSMWSICKACKTLNNDQTHVEQFLLHLENNQLRNPF